jgi:hypothetical protein
MPQLLPYKTKAWIREWDGPGYHCPPTDTWIHEDGEKVGPQVPNGSYRFHNEEDWIKFKYQSENPQIPYFKQDLYQTGIAPTH